MCGRAAQTFRTARLGAEMIRAAGMELKPTGGEAAPGDSCGGANTGSESPGAGSLHANDADEHQDNFNMSPGMDAWVVWKEDGKIKMDRKVWGLITRPGTAQKPLPCDNAARMSMHFQNLMFNARSDTLYSKPTFSRLAAQGKTCLIALDGYFEWKMSPIGGKRASKQPYFVYRGVDDKKLLLVAGLWTQVQTGLSDQPTLDTFTMLTTEACPQIDWLHHRMPICVWDLNIGLMWLGNPSPQVLKSMDDAARQQKKFSWHMVTTEMSNLKFRGRTAIAPIAQPKSVSSFFAKVSSTNKDEMTKDPSIEKQKTAEREDDKQDFLLKAKDTTVDLVKKRKPVAAEDPTPPSKKPKPATKGLISSYFQKKI